jgi:hypothetical protein
MVYIKYQGFPSVTIRNLKRISGQELMEKLPRIPEQQGGLVFRFYKIIPGIITSVIMKKYPSVETAHEYFK